MFRWTARVTGVFLVAFVVAPLMLGHGFQEFQMASYEFVMLIAFLAALAGMLLLWKWEGIGGALVLAGMASFYGLNFAKSGEFPGGWVFPLCFVPGVFSLASWWWERKKNSASISPNG